MVEHFSFSCKLVGGFCFVDLPDGGASHIAETVVKIKEKYEFQLIFVP